MLAFGLTAISSLPRVQNIAHPDATSVIARRASASSMAARPVYTPPVAPINSEIQP